MTNPQDPNSYNSNPTGSNLPSYGENVSSDNPYSTPQQPAAYGASAEQGQNPGYQAYQGYPVNSVDNGVPGKKSVLAIWALVIGIVALLSSSFALGLFFGIAGIVIAIVALVRNRKKAPECRRTWMSVVGLVLSVVGIIATIIFASVLAMVTLQECGQYSNDPAALQTCMENFGS